MVLQNKNLMKRLSLLITMLLTAVTVLTAQNADDALRYSQEFYGGTARFNSMGGAFTALGGDISSLNQNPAGLGVFRSSEITITPLFSNFQTTARFNGKAINNLYNFNLGQIGVVSKIVSNSEGLMTLNVAYSYNRANNLGQSINIHGVSNSSSMADYWAALGNQNGGTNFHDLGGAEGIAFDAWVMDTITGSGGNHYGTVFSNYGDNPPSIYGQTVRRLISNEGYLGEHSLSIGGNYSNKVFFGATLGITTLRYTSHYEHMEATNTPLASQFQDFTYTDHFEDKGTGYSLKLGAIFRPNDIIRIGLAFHTPTWFKIDEYYYNNITSRFTDGSHNEFSNTPSRFNYALATPFRALAGLAVQLEKYGLISVDYEYIDYSSARFSETGDGYDYSLKNSEIKDAFKPTSNIRLGGELRLNSLYLRAGYGLYGKSFKSDDDNADLHYNALSVGAGLREKNFSIDFAFTNFKYSQKYVLYPVDLGIDPAVANLDANKNIFTLTLGYKFGM